MWSDVVLTAERAMLFRLLLWAGASVLAGTAVLVVRARGNGSPLLAAFGATCVGVGAMEIATGLLRLEGLGLRDLASAARLERLSWLQIGLWLGLVVVGLSVVFTARGVGAPSPARPVSDAESVVGRRRALLAMGMGSALVVHGAALAFLATLLAAEISR